MAQATVRMGDKGAAVRELQQALTRAGFDAGKADGHFGKRTMAALKAFQTQARLRADGIAGARTWAALRERGALAPVRAAAQQQKTAATLTKPATSATKPATSSAKPATSAKPPPAGRSVSDAGAAFIAQFEGFSAELYDDAAGHATIGFGHLVHRGPIDGTEPAEFRAGISRQRGLELLKSDAQKAADAVHRLTRVGLDQAQFDALVSFTFNCGAGALETSTLLRKLNDGDYAAVPSELARWNKAGGKVLAGLTRRRAAEGVLFTTGRYA